MQVRHIGELGKVLGPIKVSPGPSQEIFNTTGHSFNEHGLLDDLVTYIIFFHVSFQIGFNNYIYMIKTVFLFCK